MSDNVNFPWLNIVETSPERKRVKSERSIITLRFAKIRYQTKGEHIFSVRKREFREWSQENSGFNEAYARYSESGDKKYAPVIELIDKGKEYGLDNIKWICQKDKNRKNGRRIAVLEGDKNQIIFPSARRAEMAMELPKGVLSRALRTSGKYKNMKVNFHEFHEGKSGEG